MNTFTWNDENLLEVVELLADEMGMISSELDLSAKFDAEVMPGLLEQFGKPGEQFTDQPMIDETFNNWADMLCKEGELHSVQYHEYCNVGEYAD